MLMRNRRKTLLRDHSVPGVTLKAYLKHTQSQPYLKPSPLEDLKDLPIGLVQFNLRPKDDRMRMSPCVSILLSVCFACCGSISKYISSIYILSTLVDPNGGGGITDTRPHPYPPVIKVFKFKCSFLEKIAKKRLSATLCGWHPTHLENFGSTTVVIRPFYVIRSILLKHCDCQSRYMRYISGE